jgi:2-polyprenyl-6-methoxyphenol hydroxylase-like FAD-dependent oxidoreductase
MKVLVMGGSIGGLATALNLHAVGIEYEVFEQSRSIRELGVGINMLPHAIKELGRVRRSWMHAAWRRSWRKRRMSCRPSQRMMPRACRRQPRSSRVTALAVSNGLLTWSRREHLTGLYTLVRSPAMRSLKRSSRATPRWQASTHPGEPQQGVSAGRQCTEACAEPALTGEQRSLYKRY